MANKSTKTVREIQVLMANKYLNFSDCFSGTPSIWREHCFGCLSWLNKVHQMNIVLTQSRRQSSRLRGAKRLSGGGQSLKLCTKATVFKKVSMLIGEGQAPHLAPALH